MGFSITKMTVNSDEKVIAMSWVYQNEVGKLARQHKMREPHGGDPLASVTTEKALGWLNEQLTNTPEEFDALIAERQKAIEHEESRPGTTHRATAPTKVVPEPEPEPELEPAPIVEPDPEPELEPAPIVEPDPNRSLRHQRCLLQKRAKEQLVVGEAHFGISPAHQLLSGPLAPFTQRGSLQQKLHFWDHPVQPLTQRRLLERSRPSVESERHNASNSHWSSGTVIRSVTAFSKRSRSLASSSSALVCVMCKPGTTSGPVWPIPIVQTPAGHR